MQQVSNASMKPVLLALAPVVAIAYFLLRDGTELSTIPVGATPEEATVLQQPLQTTPPRHPGSRPRRVTRTAVNSPDAMPVPAQAAAVVTSPQARAPTAEGVPQPGAGSLSGIAFSFLLDPRLTRSLYMGERWASTPTYTRVQETGKPMTLEVKAAGLDSRGAATRIVPTWTPADPAMVTVTPPTGDAVNITVHHAGESRIEVSAEGISRQLSIKASPIGKNLKVDISQ